MFANIYFSIKVSRLSSRLLSSWVVQSSHTCVHSLKSLSTVLSTSSRKYEPSLRWPWPLWLKLPLPMVSKVLTLCWSRSGRVSEPTGARVWLPSSRWDYSLILLQSMARAIWVDNILICWMIVFYKFISKNLYFTFVCAFLIFWLCMFKV